MGLTTTKYFRWDDPGALKLDGTAGSFYAIIKHCLTEAGWSVAFDDPGNFKIALRNSMAHGGSGGYLRVHDNGSFTGGGRVASWQTYESMTDIDTGTLQCCDDWIWKAREAGGAQGADAVRRCWVIVADERTCYPSTWVGDDNANPRGVNPTPPDATGISAGYLCMSAFAGDIEPFVPGDLGFGGCGMTTQNPATGTTALVLSWLGARRGSSGTTMRLSRSSTLSASVTQVAVAGNEAQASIVGHGSSHQPVISSNSPLMVLPGLVTDGAMLRGRMRGLYVPQNDLVTGGGAPLGIEVTPFLASSTAKMASLTGSVQNHLVGAFRLFVETAKSWDDI